MLYFAYGSNMSIRRLHQRVPSACFVAVATLLNHKLKFHKVGFKDGSGKCDAMKTGDTEDFILGVVFEIKKSEKTDLDRNEGLGFGYDEKSVIVTSIENENIEAITYYATNIDASVKPYHWYKEHVLRGARENGLPESYIQTIARVESISDLEPERHKTEMAIYR